MCASTVTGYPRTPTTVTPTTRPYTVARRLSDRATATTPIRTRPRRAPRPRGGGRARRSRRRSACGRRRGGFDRRNASASLTELSPLGPRDGLVATAERISRPRLHLAEHQQAGPRAARGRARRAGTASCGRWRGSRAPRRRGARRPRPRAPARDGGRAADRSMPTTLARLTDTNPGGLERAGLRPRSWARRVAARRGGAPRRSRRAVSSLARSRRTARAGTCPTPTRRPVTTSTHPSPFWVTSTWFAR